MAEITAMTSVATKPQIIPPAIWSQNLVYMLHSFDHWRLPMPNNPTSAACNAAMVAPNVA